MAHAGRTIVFSGVVVSLGLALMLLMPVPFLRGFGLGGLLVPAISVLCALTLLPVLLLALGERLERLRLIPARLAQRRDAFELRFWTRHTPGGRCAARSGLRPPSPRCSWSRRCRSIGIRVGPSSTGSLPQGLASVKGLVALQSAGSRYAADPTTIVVGPSADAAATADAVAKLRRLLRADPQVTSVSAPAPRPERAGTSGSTSAAGPTPRARRPSRSPRTSAAP